MRSLFYILIILSFDIFAQSIDKIEAVIGGEIVLTSDIEAQYLQYLSQGGVKSSEIRCEVIEDLLLQKILVNQAKLDSVDISVDEVEKEISNRMSYFEKQLGSVAKMEEYFGKSSSKRSKLPEALSIGRVPIQTESTIATPYTQIKNLCVCDSVKIQKRLSVEGHLQQKA